MKLNIARLFCASFFISIAFISSAQDSALADLIPFKKGNKWGLIHYNTGKEFYKPVFDTIVFDRPYILDNYSIFQTEDSGLRAKVVFNRQKMWMLPNKALKPGGYDLKGYGGEEKEDDNTETELKEIVDISPIEFHGEQNKKITDRTIVESFKMNDVIVSIEKIKNDYHFFINRQEIKEFVCKRYSKIPGSSYVILCIDTLFGIGNLATQKFSVRPQYYFLAWNYNCKAVVADCDRHTTGIIDTEGNIMLPIRYQSIGESFLFNDGSRLFIAVKNKNYKLVTINNGKIIEANTDYEYLQSSNTGKQLVFIAVKNKKAGVINAKDSILIPFNYSSVDNHFFSYGDRNDPRFFILRSGDLYGFADAGRNFFRIEPKYSEISGSKPIKVFHDKRQVYLFAVRKSGEFFYVDNLGKEFVSN